MLLSLAQGGPWRCWLPWSAALLLTRRPTGLFAHRGAGANQKRSCEDPRPSPRAGSPHLVQHPAGVRVGGPAGLPGEEARPGLHVPGHPAGRQHRPGAQGHRPGAAAAAAEEEAEQHAAQPPHPDAAHQGGPGGPSGAAARARCDACAPEMHFGHVHHTWQNCKLCTSSFSARPSSQFSPRTRARPLHGHVRWQMMPRLFMMSTHTHTR